MTCKSTDAVVSFFANLKGPVARSWPPVANHLLSYFQQPRSSPRTRSLADSCMIAWRIMSLVSIKSMNARKESYIFSFYSFLHALIVRVRSFQTGSHFSTFYPPKKVVSLHSHCDTRCTSKISDIFLRFLAKIPEVDKREEKREIIPKQYCLLELVWWTGLWLWSAYELQVRTHIQTKRSIRSRGIRRGCWWYSQTEETVAVDEPI